MLPLTADAVCKGKLSFTTDTYYKKSAVFLYLNLI